MAARVEGDPRPRTHALPVIWDADFLFGAKTGTGDDTYVLCEINASSTFAFPEFAMPTVAEASIGRIREHKHRGEAPTRRPGDVAIALRRDRELSDLTPLRMELLGEVAASRHSDVRRRSPPQAPGRDQEVTMRLAIIPLWA